MENNAYSDVKIIKKIKKNQLIEIDGICYYLRSADELDTAYQLILSRDDNEMVYCIDRAIQTNDFSYFDNKKENIDKLYKLICNKMIENYPKYKKKVYEFIKEREEDFFELDNSQKCIVIFEMIRVMKRGEQYINIPFEPYNLKNDRKGRLNGQSILLDNTYFYDVSITGIYSKKYKL